MARAYKRDGNGRFAGGGGSSGGGGGKRPAAKSVSRGVNRLTRDNAGKITSVGGTGATARGGRLKTAAGNKRATQTAKVSGGKVKGTISKKRQGMSDSDKQSVQMAKALRSGKPNPAVDAVRRRQAAAKAEPASKSKTDLQVMQQADRMMGKLSKRMASIQVDKVGLNEGLRQVRRNNARAGKVKTALAKRGLLEKYTKLTAPADAIRMTPAGRGIPKPGAAGKVGQVKPSTPKPTNAKGARLGGTRKTTKAAAPKNTTPNKTGQSKTLNKFNSRPVGTMVAGKGINLVPSTKRVPLQVQRKESDLAFARVATKAAKQQAAAPAKAAARQTAANRPARALANQKRTAQAIAAKGGKRPTPTRKQKKSLAIADAARTFYSANRVNSIPGFKVDTSKPGYRKPKPRP